MQIIVSSNELKNSLSELSGVISSNTVLPILEDFLFEVLDNELQVTGSDVETRIQVRLPAQISDNTKDNNSFCVSSKILVEYLKNLPDQPLNIKYNNSENSIELSSNTGKYKIGTESSNEYPKAADKNTSESFTLTSNTFKEAINRTLFATSNDSLRPAMTGVLFDMKQDKVNIVATDAHRLIKLELSNKSMPNDTSIIVPKKPLQLLKSILPANDEPVNISFSNTHIYVEQDSMVLSSRLIDAKYPPYMAVIPTDNPFTLVIDKAELINSLRRVSVFASKGTSQVVFDIAGNTLNISAQDIDFSYEGKETLSCQYNGEDMKIAFNARLLIEMLSSLEGEKISIHLSMPSRAGIFRSDDKIEDEDLLMLLMPLIVSI